MGQPRSVAAVVLAVAAVLLLAVVVWLSVVYTGAYNVAATDPNADIVRWSFETTMRRSVRSRAQTVTPPAQVSAQQLRKGAEEYALACAHCHGAPGREHEAWAENMRPEPPELTHAASEWELREVFWIAKHGIKMSGMPAFGPEHDDATLWGIAAFVKRLPAMTPQEYASATGGTGHEHGGDDR